MRKSIISTTTPTAPGNWLDLDLHATAELSSEDPTHTLESALHPHTSSGWRASTPGPQLIRLRFDKPLPIRRIHLEFREETLQRSQEIALFATSTTSPRKELIRQQWTFSPGGSTTEVEDFLFDLHDITVLDLEIDPGRHDRQAIASLHLLQIA